MAKQNISDRFVGGNKSLKQKEQRLTKATGGTLLPLIFDESVNNDSIRIQLVNHSNQPKAIALFPGALDTVEKIAAIAGIRVDAIACDGDVITEGEGESKKAVVSCVCPNLGFIQDEVNHCPQRILGLQLQTDNESQFFETIDVTEFGLTCNYGKASIKPSTYLEPSNPNKTLVLINDFKHLQLDRNRVMVINLAAGRQLDISFTLGSRFSSAQLLTDAAEMVIG